MELYNELVILMMNYLCMLITGSFIQDNKWSSKMGIVMIALVVFSFGLNFLPIIFGVLKELWKAIRNKYRTHLQRKSKQQKMEAKEVAER